MKCSYFEKNKVILYITMFLIIAILIVTINYCFRSEDARNLCEAIYDNDMAQLEQLLIDGANCNVYTNPLLLLPITIIVDSKLPTTPLITACAQGNVDAARLLLKYGADPNKFYLGSYSCVGAVYSSPAGRAVRYELIPLLLSYGADMEKTGHRTIITQDEHAAFLELEHVEDAEKSIELLKVMVENPSELENGDGNTLLEMTDNESIKKWLLEQA